MKKQTTELTSKTHPSATKAVGYATLPSFKGIYDPSNLHLKKISTGLRGIILQGSESGIGPNYLATPSLAKELNEFLNGKTISEAAKTKLTKMRAFAGNFRAFLTNGEIKPVVEYSKTTDNFIDELKSNITVLNTTAKKVGLSNEETDFLNTIISQTAPTLYAMGFNDAIAHSTQVSRKCMIETLKQKGTSTEILQSAIVGWIHDPKFPVSYSWSNLATHPVIASSIANNVLNDAENIKTLSKMLKKEDAVVKFTKGISEALLTNNDSDFVMNQVILNKAGYMPNSETGIADLVEGAKEIAQKRFEASQKGEMPPTFPLEIRKKMHEVSFETGIKGIEIDKLKLVLKELSTKYPGLNGNFWQDMFCGEIKDKALLADVKSGLIGKNAILDLRVSGDNLFCHHKEVVNAPIAAKSLIIADPMLLSPHKILAEGSQKTAVGRIQSFINSFNNNIKSAPFEYKNTAKEWQKKVYAAMIKSADELTGGNNLQRINNDTTSSIDAQIDSMIQILNDKNTWGNFADINPEVKDADFEKLFNSMSKNYTKTAETSKEMFAV